MKDKTRNKTSPPEALRIIVAVNSGKTLDEKRLCDMWVSGFGGSLSSSQESDGTLAFTWIGMDAVKLIAEGERGVLDKHVRNCGGDALLEILNSEGECYYQFVPKMHFTGGTPIKVVGKTMMEEA